MIDKKYDGSDFLVNFYDGAYGPTIRIDTRSIESVEQIKSIFLELATANVKRINFLEATSVKAVGIRGLVFELLSEQEEGALKLMQIAEEGPVFHWLESSESWLERAELIDGMLKFRHAGHQYLTDEEIDDAILLFAFQET